MSTGRLWIATLLLVGQAPPPQSAFCAATSSLPNSRTILMTNVFQTSLTAKDLAAQITSLYENQGVSVIFTCSIDPSSEAQTQRFFDALGNASTKGYDVQVVKPPPS